MQAPNHVRELTPSNCETEIQKRKIVGVCIYAPWCGHCHSFLPTWEKVSKKLKDMNFCRIDGSEYVDFCEEMFPQWEGGYPTILFYVNGEFHKEYTSSRQEMDLVQYCMKLIKDNE